MTVPTSRIVTWRPFLTLTLTLLFSSLTSRMKYSDARIWGDVINTPSVVCLHRFSVDLLSSRVPGEKPSKPEQNLISLHL